MNFTKTILKPGKYLVQTPAGERKVEEITAERLQGWSDRFTKMLAAGLRIPAPYRHDASVPLAKTKRSAKDNAGFWKKLSIDDKGALVGELDVPNKEDSDRIGKTVQEVSPYVKTWDDGDGNHWDDSILHIALVTNPIIPNQENFVPQSDTPALALCLSQILATPMELAAEMSMDQIRDVVQSALREKTEDAWIADVYDDHVIYNLNGKHYNLSYTLKDSVATLGDTAKEVTRSVVYEAKTALQMADETGDGVNPEGATLSLKTAIASLKSVGLSLPDDTTAENLVERIVIASKAIAESKKSEEGTGGEETEEEKAKREQPTPVAMSTNLDSGGELMSVEMNFATKLVGAEYVRRIDTLVSQGKISPAYATKTLKPMLEGYKLSLGEDGEPAKGTLDLLLDALESLPENPNSLAADPKSKGLRLAHEEEIPAESLGDPAMDEKRQKEVVDAQLAASGR